jgi:coenzyme F420-0:L-glutamate ligase/coenzyme F420-1:gamma-L-glutamate ligase
MGRPWRDGQVDAALGAAGVAVTDDLRGGTDGYGNPLEVTVRAVADELAALADLVKGKLDGRPAALVRGLGALVTREDGPGASALLRAGPQDWFRYGHVEAVRAAVGVPPGSPDAPLVPVGPTPPADRLARAVAVAQASPHWPIALAVEVHPLDAAGDGATAEVLVPAGATGGAGTAVLLAAGALAQRIAVLAAAEDLDVVLEPPAGDGRVVVRASQHPGGADPSQR